MKKQIIVLFALALFASVFICQNAQAESALPWNVHVTVTYNGDSYTYDLSENIVNQSGSQERAFYSAKSKLDLYNQLTDMGLPIDAIIQYVLPNFGDLLQHFGYVERTKLDATVTFGKSGFNYTNGQDGISIDKEYLVKYLLTHCGKSLSIKLPLIIDKALTVKQLQSVTVVKGTFTTTFTNSGVNRCHNVSLATDTLNGVTVGANETFSFNKTVGERSEKNGYLTSKVIMDGNYTDGLGGGVCQVSTTLYNALLLSGFIPKATQHSLVPSYVKAGFDAMVSYGVSDLTFVNDSGYPVYIKGFVKNKTVTFVIYGAPNTYDVVCESTEVRDPFAVKYITDKKLYPNLIYTDQMQTVINGSDGVKTKSYLCYYSKGILVERKLIRTNVYKKVDKIVARGNLIRGEINNDE